MRPHRREWQLACAACGFLASTLEPPAEAAPGDSALDEAHRAAALEELRRENFERVLDLLAKQLEPRGRTLLDVGCAHGWFLDAAARRGFRVTGLEPDPRIAALGRARGHEVIGGFFPDALPSGAAWDVLTFHDVFEHLPDPEAALAACRERLREGGLLVLNLPNRRGAFFRAASALERLGVAGPLERLWQKGFPSPHLSYFEPGGLARLALRHGFRELHRSDLPTLSRRGLWSRLRYDRSASLAASSVQWLAITLATPALALLPSDISLQIFRR